MMQKSSNLAKRRLGTRRQPEVSRNSILKAALVEFGQEGLPGARMDAIAGAAGVNKPLAYYCFHDKDELYGAVLVAFFVRLTRRVAASRDGTAPAGERFLRYVRAHFDTIAESPYYARLFQSELMSAGRGKSVHMERIFRRYIHPIAMRLVDVLGEGIASGEFRPVDPLQYAPSAVGSIVHYFVTAPLMRKFRPGDPFSLDSMRKRRAAVLDFAAAALFTNREAGIQMAARVAAAEQGGPPDAVTAEGGERRDPRLKVRS